MNNYTDLVLGIDSGLKPQDNFDIIIPFNPRAFCELFVRFPLSK